jgi:uncharacterized membrane protein
MMDWFDEGLADFMTCSGSWWSPNHRAVRWPAGRTSERRKRTALDILEERYARGEIGREEFEQKRRDLER